MLTASVRVLGLGVLALLIVPQDAHASRTFSDEIAEALGASRAPACTVCHQRGDNGVAVPTPFSSSLASFGFDRRRADSIGPALSALEVAATDSDGDGVGDVAELRAQRDPNVAEAGGCSVAGGAPTSRGKGLLVLLGVGLTLVSRRARRGPRR